MGRHLGLLRRYSFPVELLEKKVSVMPWIHISRTWNHIDTNYYVWPFLPIWALWVSPLLIKNSSNRHWRPFAHLVWRTSSILKHHWGYPQGMGAGKEWSGMIVSTPSTSALISFHPIMLQLLHTINSPSSNRSCTRCGSSMPVRSDGVSRSSGMMCFRGHMRERKELYYSASAN